MLLDPFEEQLDLSAVLVELGDHVRRQVRVVGQENQGLAAEYSLRALKLDLARMTKKVPA